MLPASACQLYGPMIFSALKTDKRTMNQQGHGRVAAKLEKDVGWASAVATNADRGEKIMGPMVRPDSSWKSFHDCPRAL